MTHFGEFHLEYFNARGKAESIKIAFELCGIKWTEKDYTIEEWRTTSVKQTQLFGQVPKLTHKFNGQEFELWQSGSILQYLGRIFGLYPTLVSQNSHHHHHHHHHQKEEIDEETLSLVLYSQQVSLIDMLIDHEYDIRTKLANIIYTRNGYSDYEKDIKNYKENDLINFFTPIEKLLEKSRTNGNKWIMPNNQKKELSKSSDSEKHKHHHHQDSPFPAPFPFNEDLDGMTVGDICLFVIVDDHISLDCACLRMFPEIIRFYKQFKSLEAIQRYIRSERRVPKIYLNGKGQEDEGKEPIG